MKTTTTTAVRKADFLGHSVSRARILRAQVTM